MPKLKPCPFCGRVDKLIVYKVEHPLDDQIIRQYTICCNASGDNTGCGACCGYKMSEEEAIEAWNGRTGAKRETELMESIRQAHNWMAITYGCVQSNLTGLLLSVDALEHQYPELERPEYLPRITMKPPEKPSEGGADNA